jgi:hypothetical protein
MSASMVDDGHIDYLVTAVRKYDIRNAYIPSSRLEDGELEAIRLTDMTDTELGRMLLGTNLSSMMARYGDRLQEGEVAAVEDVEDYTYRRWTGPVSAIQTVKAVGCLAYQCCEYDGWKDSLARDVIERIKAQAIKELPGYDEAAWELSRDDAAVINRGE